MVYAAAAAGVLIASDIGMSNEISIYILCVKPIQAKCQRTHSEAMVVPHFVGGHTT